MVKLKECKTRKYQNKLQQLHWEGQGKDGRPRKRWKDDVQEGLNIVGIKYRRAMATDRRKWGRIVLEAKVHNGLSLEEEEEEEDEEEEEKLLLLLLILTYSA